MNLLQALALFAFCFALGAVALIVPPGQADADCVTTYPVPGQFDLHLVDVEIDGEPLSESEYHDFQAKLLYQTEYNAPSDEDPGLFLTFDDGENSATYHFVEEDQ